jgi:hypothetical protein
MKSKNRPILFTLLVSTFLLGTPALVLARGGGGGGGHGGGGGGGHFGGGGARFGGYGGGYGRGYGGYGGYGRGYGGWGRGYGWGGYPYYGYGLGLGLGVGYGLSAGYGYGYGGYGGYGYGGYGYGGGYGGYGGYGYGYPAYGGYGYDPYYGAGAGYAPNAAPYAGPPATPASPMSAPASISSTKQDLGTLASVKEFAEKGEAAFKSGNYQGAVYAWRHAVVDDPQNGLMTMMLGQALFATGKYEEAAGATQAAMHHLPKEQWGIVVSHYTELYGKTHDYTEQLRALEKAMKSKSDDPALRFLTGFQYAQLGFTEQAIDQLNHAIKLAPRDEMAKQLRDSLRAKITKPSAIPPLPGISSGPELKATPEDSDDEQ